mgnify:CR=1 FL=1
MEVQETRSIVCWTPFRNARHLCAFKCATRTSKQEKKNKKRRRKEEEEEEEEEEERRRSFLIHYTLVFFIFLSLCLSFLLFFLSLSLFLLRRFPEQGIKLGPMLALNMRRQVPKQRMLLLVLAIRRHNRAGSARGERHPQLPPELLEWVHEEFFMATNPDPNCEDAHTRGGENLWESNWWF